MASPDLAPGSAWWVPDGADGWAVRTLEAVADKPGHPREGHLTFGDKPGEKDTFLVAQVHATDPSHFAEGMDDIAEMGDLHLAPLFDCIRRRFLADQIYTNIGDILISVNPYEVSGASATCIQSVHLPSV